jgi:hypothetical protein
MTPDENHDVIVHYFKVVDALTGDVIGDRWTVWVGPESEGAFDNEGEAMATALALSAELSRPAWLLKERYPLIPIAQ